MNESVDIGSIGASVDIGALSWDDYYLEVVPSNVVVSLDGFFSNSKVGTDSAKAMTLLTSSNLVKSLVKDFINIASSEAPKFGVNGDADFYLQEIASEYPNELVNFLNELVIQKFDTPKLLVSCLKAMGNLSYNSSFYTFFGFAMAAYSNKSVFVKEAVIHLLEKWPNEYGLKFLKNCDEPPALLKQYKDKVTSELEKLLGS